jgi:DNA-binding transcriptional ArsR family regulator
MSITQRRVAAAEEMRALAHPLRLQLLELLASEGAFTASEAARRLDDTPANVSWHLRKLATYGFVRQGEGPGRARPWKFVAQSLTFGEDAEDPTAATALTDLFLEREFHVLRTSLRQQPTEDQAWRDATAVLQGRCWLTPAEAAAVGARLKEVLLDEELLERNQDPTARPSGARLMALMSWVVPYGDQPAADSPRADQSAAHTEGITASRQLFVSRASPSCSRACSPA